MAANVHAEEIQALLGTPEAASATPVAARDFRRPRRLSSEQLARVRRVAQREQLEVQAAFQAALRSPTKLEIVAVHELAVDELMASLADPLALLVFDAGGVPCWTVWESSAAVSVAERLLGANEVKASAPRVLSAVEQSLIKSLLVKATQLVASTLGIEPKNPRYVQSLEALHLAQELPPKSDPQRLCVQIAIESPAGTSTLRIYLQGASMAEIAPPPTTNAKDKSKAALPGHLGEVEVALAAQLAEIELPLDQLLAIEPGDVIPLGIGKESALTILVEDEQCGRARWGERGGRVALRITEIHRHQG